MGAACWAAPSHSLSHSPSPLPLLKKTVLLYGILGGLLIAVLKLIEYRFLVLEHSLETLPGAAAAFVPDLTQLPEVVGDLVVVP